MEDRSIVSSTAIESDTGLTIEILEEISSALSMPAWRPLPGGFLSSNLTLKGAGIGAEWSFGQAYTVAGPFGLAAWLFSSCRDIPSLLMDPNSAAAEPHLNHRNDIHIDTVIG